LSVDDTKLNLISALMYCTVSAGEQGQPEVPAAQQQQQQQQQQQETKISADNDKSSRRPDTC